MEFCKIEEKKLSPENLVKKKAKTKAAIGVKSKPEKPQSLTPKKSSFRGYQAQKEGERDPEIRGSCHP